MANAISNITLCKVPITATHQIDFGNITAQQNYFSSKAKVNFPKCKYQARSGTMKVKGYVDTLQNCNYGFYTNSYNGTSKTFYFWIVAKNFLSRETTELTIQIDVFQTWLFDFTFSPCMIEREHVNDDTFGKHTIPEDFELGDYVTYTKKPVSALTGNPCFFVGITDTSSGTLGGIFGHTYSGFLIKYFAYNDTANLTSFITDLCNNGKADSIAFIFTFPQSLVDSLNLTSGDVFAGIEGVVEATETFNWSTLVQNFNYNGDNHSAYNSKIFTYPFNFITVKNSSGGNVVLKFENFIDSDDISFSIQSVVTQTPNISCTPKNYCNKTFAIDDSILLNEYGLCSWNNDNYANWYAQHRNSITAQSVNASASFNANKNVAGNNYNNSLASRDTQSEKGAINTLLSTANAIGGLNILGGVSNAVGGVANNYLDYQQNTRNANNDLQNNNLMNTNNYQNAIRSIVASVKDAQVQPNTAKGSTSTCGLDLARNTATFYIEQVGIKPEYAKIIDMYFQMFGYQVNDVKTPNFKTRTKWNYLKTVNCSTYGEIPHEDLNALNDMFNNGLTVWHNEANMYLYDTVNSIVV